jgi:ankyrin repeat protein
MNTWIEHLKNNDYKKVQQLLNSGEDVNETNESGESVLMYAIRSHCDYELLMLLVQSGADIYAIDHEGVSVFDMAITYNNVAMVEFFLEKNIDVNATQRKSGFTPLMCASCYGRGEIVQLLLQNNADKDAIDMKGLTATEFARKMNKKSVLRLLDYDANAPKNTVYAR